MRPASGPTQLGSILEALAMMRPATMGSLQQLALANARDAIPSGATIFFVAGQLRESAVAYVTELAQRGHPVTTLWVGREDPPAIPALNFVDYRSVFGVGRTLDESVYSRPGSNRHRNQQAVEMAPLG